MWRDQTVAPPGQRKVRLGEGPQMGIPRQMGSAEASRKGLADPHGETGPGRLGHLPLGPVPHRNGPRPKESPPVQRPRPYRAGTGRTRPTRESHARWGGLVAGGPRRGRTDGVVSSPRGRRALPWSPQRRRRVRVQGKARTDGIRTDRDFMSPCCGTEEWKAHTLVSEMRGLRSLAFRVQG